MPEPRKAVVLLSGGVDSTTTLAIAKSVGFQVYALSFGYGQRHEAELAAARRVAAALGVAGHEVVAFDLRRFRGSALAGDRPLPKGRAPATTAREVPGTHAPARNTPFPP